MTGTENRRWLRSVASAGCSLSASHPADRTCPPAAPAPSLGACVCGSLWWTRKEQYALVKGDMDFEKGESLSVEVCASSRSSRMSSLNCWNLLSRLSSCSRKHSYTDTDTDTDAPFIRFFGILTRNSYCIYSSLCTRLYVRILVRQQDSLSQTVNKQINKILLLNKSTKVVENEKSSN